MSKPAARNRTLTATGEPTSVPRTALAAAVALLGVAWIVVYVLVARNSGTSGSTWPWMAGLDRWNYLIGFGLVLLGLVVAAHKLTPLGRGQGVVVGMLFCFLFGLAWIVVYYFLGTDSGHFPPMDDLRQYNLVVGIAFMAVGFTYATKWE